MVQDFTTASLTYICLLLLIYLFFFRVLRAVWVGVRPTGETAPRRARNTRTSKAVLPPAALIVRTPETQQGTRYDFAAEITDSQWDATVLQSTEPVFVDFWADWCAPCKAMGPYVDKLAEEYEGKVKVLKINTQDNPEVPAKYGITAIPTFLLIKGGEVVKQMVGQQPYDELKKVVDAHL